MRSGRPFPLINRVLCRLCQHGMSALDVDELDRAIGRYYASALTLPLRFMERGISGYTGVTRFTILRVVSVWSRWANKVGVDIRADNRTGAMAARKRFMSVR